MSSFYKVPALILSAFCVWLNPCSGLAAGGPSAFLRWRQDLIKFSPALCSGAGSTIGTVGAFLEVHVPRPSPSIEVGIDRVEFEETASHSCQLFVDRFPEIVFLEDCVKPVPDEAKGYYRMPGRGTFPDGVHDGAWTGRVYVRYREVGEPTWSDPILLMEIPFTIENLGVEVEGPNEDHVLLWDPFDEPPAASRQVSISFPRGAQRQTADVQVTIHGASDYWPVKTVTWANVETPGSYLSFTWDGAEDFGRMAQAGVYPFDVAVGDLRYPFYTLSSPYLKTEWDLEANPSGLVRFLGKDDKGTMSFDVEYRAGEGDPRNGPPPCPTPRRDARSGKFVLYSGNERRGEWSVEELACELHGGAHDGLVTGSVQQPMPHRLRLEIPEADWPDQEEGFLAMVFQEDRETDEPDHEGRDARPQVLPMDAPVISLATKGFTSFGLKRDGTLWSWGQNNAGQLGDGTTNSRSRPGRVWGYWAARDFTFLMNRIVSMAAGGSHALALRSLARNLGRTEVWAWGENRYGQLGDGTNRARLLGVQVVAEEGAGYLENVIDVAAGFDHSLARKRLKNGVIALSWGLNETGQLGNGTTANRNRPGAVLGPLFIDIPTDVAFVTGGERHSLAIRSSSNNSVWGWGDNFLGQLGFGSFTPNQRLLPTPAVQVGGGGPLRDVYMLATSSNFNLAAVDPPLDRPACSWGSNSRGQLGDGTTTNRPGPVWVLGFGEFPRLERIFPRIGEPPPHRTFSLAAGVDHSLALLGVVADGEGSVYSWGGNEHGQLGDGTQTDRRRPGAVRGPNGIGWLYGISVAAGSGHSLALNKNGTAWAWGLNHFGQLGDGTTTDRLTPVRVRF